MAVLAQLVRARKADRASADDDDSHQSAPPSSQPIGMDFRLQIVLQSALATVIGISEPVKRVVHDIWGENSL